MRAFIFAIALAVAGSAVAQDAPGGYGPYRFGMSPAEARTASGGQWQNIAETEDNAILVNGPVLKLGEIELSPVLQFQSGRLYSIEFNTGGIVASRERCEAGVAHLLGELAREGGAFDGDRTMTESAGAPVETRTSDGSRVRAYMAANDRMLSFANRPGATFAELEVRYGVLPEMRVSETSCLLRLSFLRAAPFTEAELRANAPSVEALEAAPRIAAAQWVERPDAQTFARYYPRSAIEQGIAGTATLECLVEADGSLRCVISEEAPADNGFGLAALAIARAFRMAPQTAEGVSTAGGRIRIPIRFNLLP